MRGGVVRTSADLIMARFQLGARSRHLRPNRLHVALAMLVPVFFRLRAFGRDERGATPIELALGAVVLVSTAALGFDLYSLSNANTAIGRMAATMADYVSRDTDPVGDEMSALGGYLYTHELPVPAHLVYVVTALHQPSGDPSPGLDVLWSDDTIRFGDSTATAELAAGCARFVDEDGAAVPPDGFTMADDEVLIIAEVCVRLTREGSLTGRLVAGDLYRLHALPARDPDQRPAAPTHSAHDGGPTTVASAAGRTGRFGGTSRRAARTLVTVAKVRT